MKRQRYVQNAIRFIVGAALIGWLLLSVGWERVFATIQEAHAAYFAAALVLYALTVILRAIRWQQFLNAQGITASLRILLPLDLIGGFFNLILPGSIGGDVVKFVRLDQRYPGVGKPRIAGTLIADRVAGISVLLWLGALMTPFALGNNPLTATTVTLALLSTVTLAALLTTRGRAVLQRLPGIGRLLTYPPIASLYTSLAHYKPTVIARAFGVALIFNLAMIGCYAALGTAFDLPVAWSVYFVIVPLLSLAQAIPITPNGLGLREGGAVALLGLFHVSETEALALALGYLTCLMIAGAVGAAITLYHTLRPLVSLATAVAPHEGGTGAI